MKKIDYSIDPYKDEDFDSWFAMSSKLFPTYDKEQLRKDLIGITKKSRYQTFMMRVEGRNIGYTTVSIRSEYVEGSTTSPVGYWEMVFVEADFRQKGLAKALYEKAEEWILSKGCTEMGSDTWADNANSIAFHKRIGFTEDDVLVHFIKKIGN